MWTLTRIIRSIRRHGLVSAVTRAVVPTPYYYRTDIINRLIETHRYTTYLEIGVHDRSLNLHNVQCEHITCVDPNPQARADHVMTSDAFFAMNTRRFDIVFIDGLHHSDQVYRDVVHALQCLNEGGTIVCHDLNPVAESEQRRTPPATGPWTGDCWKAWVQLRTERDDLEMCVVNTDYGCGIIRRGAQPRLVISGAMDWAGFRRHRHEWLNLISVEAFKAKYPL